MATGIKFSPETIKQIKADYDSINQTYYDLLIDLSEFESLKLTNKQAIEYLSHGLKRRLLIVVRCIHNIFKIYPLETTELLSKEQLSDLTINLHAFFVNVAGILDNLAWVFVYEKGHSEKLKRTEVGLYHKKTQQYFSPTFIKYLNSTLKFWYDDYSKNYRDALAHRIPLYVPPSAINDEEQEEILKAEQSQFDSLNDCMEYMERKNKLTKLGRPCPLISHSFSEQSKLVYFHPQTLIDFKTIAEIIEIFLKELSK